MEFFELPLNPYPETFSVSINNVVYNGRTRWNAALATWVLSLNDTNDVPILSNVPLIPGIDLLAQFKYLGFGVAIATLVNYDKDAVPAYDELGGAGKVYVVTQS